MDTMASLSGTSGNDLLNGTADKDTISGLGGDDEIHGLEGNDSLNGGSGNDILYGDDGNDILNGGIGIDTMLGGIGDDTYVVDNAGDLVIEGSSAGIDLVKASVTWELASDLENLTLTGVTAINGTGNSLANILIGNSASNILDGLGGADRMKGGGGDDTYIVDNVGDVLVEGASAGTDLVKSSVSWKLGSNLENLILTASAANGTGNGLDNHITGNSAANILNGMAGADTMSGDAGDDTYVVDNPGDLVVEASATGGTDLVKSSVSFALGANLEKLTLTGSAAIDGTGNGLDNVIVGNSAANIIDGGAGADKMTGLSGNDTYMVDNIGDRAIETSASGGMDLVESSVSFALGANVENLTLIGDLAINGTGNALANIISGNAAANVIYGGGGDDTLDGGAGADSMSGGAGDDVYYVDSLSDIVTENLAEGTDTVHTTISGYQLSNNVENGVAAGGDLYGNEISNALTLEGAGSLFGGGGNDTLTGSVQNDELDGSYGDDLMIGGAGDDTYWVLNSDQIVENAGEGNDTAYVTTNGYTVSDNVETVIVSIYAENFDMTLGGGNTGNTIIGRKGDDTLSGNGGNDTLIGEDGADTLYGGAGNDTLYGEYSTTNAFAIVGADTLDGGDGNDTLVGGQLADTLTGGAGNDTFKYITALDSSTNPWDTITDFTSGSDKIDVSAIDANTGVAGDQAFAWTLFPTGVAGQWWGAPDASIPNLVHFYFDYNGGGADMRIDAYCASGWASTDIIG